MISRKALSLDFLKPVIELEYQIQQLNKIVNSNKLPIHAEISILKKRLNFLKKQVFESLTPLQRLHLVRQSNRPTTLDYIPLILDNWLELHGDRGGTDDLALIGGIGKLNGSAVMCIGHQRGRDTKENIARNFGMASPGGYRKALRLMQLANRLKFPILTFIDTPGAWAGIDAEKLGQGEAIAVNLREMFSFDVPIICTIIGEGGSGGALGIGIGDRILMLEYAVYTVATPEACAAILWKDSKQSLEAAEALKITSSDLRVLDVIDTVIPEPIGGSQADPLFAAETLKKYLLIELRKLDELNYQKRKEERYKKFRRIGMFYERILT
uniref:acetyl-CoA carboxylase, carboxyl transferase subunit alpha n=1 Tax=Hypnea cornuta TaxID=105603 RepID=UPI0027DA4AC1|nr:acetyl-CoA carboxylase, carboxyl transferase subunit alpha [Hypnea cornuta]WCH55686.1 acetyl-CoA carboxylase, carboxyl transferase subunit alpha [Hypnea cornuta]